MLLWITLGLTVIGLLLLFVGIKSDNDGISACGGEMGIIFGVSLILMLVALAINYIGTDAEIAKAEAHYEFLVAQYKTGIYESSSKLAQYNLLQKIDEWNCNLTKNQKLTHDYWIGIFMPDYYDDLNHITLNLFEDVTRGGERE